MSVALRGARPKPEGYPHQPVVIGEHLKKRRLDLGLSQREVAARVGAIEASVWNWENRRAKPELRFLPAVIAFLGYNPLSRPTTLAERLVLHRRSRGWSQKRLADELDVDPTTLARWERGEKAPWGPYAIKVEELLG